MNIATSTSRPRQIPSAATLRTRRTRRYTRKDIVEALVPLSSAVAVALFFADGGARYFGTVPETIIGTGILAGLVGTNLLLIMFILAARVPFIEKVVGHDRALTFHNQLGKPVLYLITAHFAGLIVGTALTTETPVIQQAVNYWNADGDMLKAFLAFAGMIIVVVSSIVAARRVLPYVVWHAIHLATYAVLLLSIPHQFEWGGMFAEGTAARIYWAALFIVTVLSVLIFRVIVPVVHNLRHRLVVARVDTIAPGVVSVYITGRDLDRWVFPSGSFGQWRFITPRMMWEAHPFSVSAAPNGRYIRLTVRALGDNTTALQRIRVGTRVWAEGPYGVFTDTVRTSPKVVLMAAGIGAAPIRALLEDLPAHRGDVTVILRASDAEPYLVNEITELCRSRGAKLVTLSGGRANTASWLPTEEWANGENITHYVHKPRECDYYICGPSEWMANVRADLAVHKVPAHAVHWEEFAW